MDGRPKAAYDPFLAPTMPPIPPLGGIAPATQQQQQPLLDGAPGGVAPPMMARDSSLPSIGSLMRVPTTSASPVASYSAHVGAQQQLGMYQPYSTVPAPLPAYQGVPSATGAPTATPAASESPQIYDLDKNFHLNPPVPQYPPGGGVQAAAEIPPSGYGAPYHQRPPPMGYGNYHPTSSYNYNDDYYLASTYNNYTDYGTPMGYQPVAAPVGGIVDPTHGNVLQPLGQQVTQLQPVLNQQPPVGSMVTQLHSSGNGQPPAQHHAEAPPGGEANSQAGGGKKSGSGGGEKKAEKKPTMSSMARYVCTICDGKEFVTLPVISKHIRQHNLQLCNLCVRTFETTDDLKSHECRPKGSNVSYPKCPICLKYLSNSWSLSRHMKTHNRDQSGTAGGSSASKELSSSSDIKSSESEESSNAKLDLEGSAMDCDELSKDVLRSTGGDDMELELDQHQSSSVDGGESQSSSTAMQDMMLKSPRVVVEKLTMPNFNNNNSSSSVSCKSEANRSLDTSSSCSDGNKTDDEGLVDEKTRKEQQDLPLEKCIVCGKEFKNRTYLYKHLKSVHTAKILKSPSEMSNSTSPPPQPGSPVKGGLDEFDSGNAPVKSSVVRALASKLSSKNKQLNGKPGDEDPLSTDSNNNGSNGGDYLVPLTSANANQININTSGNSITIISNVTYCNTAHEVPITTSTSGPNVGTPVTTASEALSTLTGGGLGGAGGAGGALTTIAGSNGPGALIGDGRRLSGGSGSDSGRGQGVKTEGVKEEGGLGFKVESSTSSSSPPGEGMNERVKQEPPEMSLDDASGNNKLLEPPPFIIQKVKQDVVVVTGSETTIVQPNLINSDPMMGTINPQQTPFDSQSQANAQPVTVKSEPQDLYPATSTATTSSSVGGSGSKEDPYASFNVVGMEAHFEHPVTSAGQAQAPQQPPPIVSTPGNGPQMHHSTGYDHQQQQQQQQSNQSQLDQNHQQQNNNNNSNNNSNNSNNFYGGPQPQQQQPQSHHLPEGTHNMQHHSMQQQQQQQQYMNPPPHQQQMHPQQNHPHLQGYDPMKMYQDPQQANAQQPHGHMMPGGGVGAPGLDAYGAPTTNHEYHQMGQSQPQQQQQQQQQPLVQNHQLSQLDQVENNPPSQQTSIDNSADFDGDTGGDGEQESFQSGDGAGGGDGDSEVKTQICDECGKSFAKRSQLTRHKNIHKNIIYICPFCQREPFKARNSLKNHLKTNHKDMKDKWEDPAYISAQVIKDPEKVEEYMRNWNEKTKPGLNAKGGKQDDKNPVDMLESMSNSMGGGPGDQSSATPKGKKKKGAKSKGGASADTSMDGDAQATQNGPGKVEPVPGGPDYYNGVPGNVAPPMHPHQHGYGGHNPYPNAYQPPYMGMGQQVPGAMGEYGQLPGAAMNHPHVQQPQPPPPHHHQLAGPQGSLYQAPGGYQSHHMMAPSGSTQSPYAQPYPPPPPAVAGAQQQPQHGPTVAGGGAATGNVPYGGHHGKQQGSGSVPASPHRSSLQSPMSPPVSPHPQQFYQHQLPPGHHYYGAGAQQPSGMNPYRSTSGLTSRQSPAPFSPHVQQPQRTQSTDSASSAVSGGGSGAVANQYGQPAAAPYHQQLQQQPQQPQYQYGPPQGQVQGQGAPAGIYGSSTVTGGATAAAGVGPIPPTPPPSASSFSSNASTSSTSSNSSAYGQQQQQQQQQSAAPALHHQGSYHGSPYDGQQGPPSKRPRYYPPTGPAAGHPTPPPPPQQQPQQQQQQQQNHHHVQQQQQQQQQYYGHHHMPPNGAGMGVGGGHQHQMYNGMQPPPPSASGQQSGQNMGTPGYQ